MKLNQFNTENMKSSFFSPEQEQEKEKLNSEAEDKIETLTKETDEEKLSNSIIQKAKLDGIDITEADIINYLKKGFIEKTLEIIPNYLYATLKTLQIKERSEINISISEDFEKFPNLIDHEFRLRNARYEMFYYLISLGYSKDKLNYLPNKATSPDKTKFFNEIDNMGEIFLRKIGEKQLLMQTALEASINHPKIIKK